LEEEEITQTILARLERWSWPGARGKNEANNVIHELILEKESLLKDATIHSHHRRLP